MSGSVGKREIVQRARCPFCGFAVERPADYHDGGSMPRGVCSCGAVYVCDVTGHNLGSALLIALESASGKTMDAALDVVAEVDYQDQVLERYDDQSHLVVPGGALEGRRIRGALFFLRLKERQICDQAGKAGGSDLKDYAVHRQGSKRVFVPKSFGKEDVAALVASYDTERVERLAREDKRILRDLQRLLYTGDELMRLRASDMIGRAAAIIAETEPGFVANLLQRLLSSVADSAASSWGALDAIGSIIAHRTDLYARYTQFFFDFIKDEVLAPNVLRVLCGIVAVDKDVLGSQAVPFFVRMLSSENPSIRGYAARILGFLDVSSCREHLVRIRDDKDVLEVYVEGFLKRVTVGDLAGEALGDRIDT